MRCFAGTSGYNFDAWKGIFYPEDLGPDEWLHFYAQRLPSVEINYTFYRTPNVKTLETWATQVPGEFRFSLKASQRITHRTRLADADTTTFFCDRIKVLGSQLGPTLVQLPPFFRKDADRLKTFLQSLPSHVRPALEFRNKSWFDDEIKAILQEHRAALCIADDDDLECPLWATADYGYLRLRKEVYDPAALKDWADRIKAQSWSHCFIYFKHEDGAVGVKLAHEMMALLT